ncbi:tRNA-pseudouridine synthase [Gaeumannomyces tritici R3-111a-1]|uniref:tRNA-pseudouridine synthase n=1 Tax=Gaeumannomyces tritici (strain R3-111a-1) TaxID=644352 RepID=J3PCE7_GAET3|nr:tRNA-pseudouridine synthase [Gaeumannomyces tritici R3-111a-1]EJT71917.1 tRNA-pseudouridine synthase [Gaeumannomyces tritici R3-111a-1]
MRPTFRVSHKWLWHKPLVALTPKLGLLAVRPPAWARHFITTIMAGEKANYDRWTKDSLIQRIKLLEQQLEKQSRQDTAAVVASSAASASLPTQERQGQARAPPPKKRKFADPSNYSTRFIALKLAYLGGNYNGFEYQANGKLPTIEEELWKALVKTCLVFPERGPDEVDFASCEYSKCGRTDRGVSAFGQVVALRVRSNRPVPRARKQQQQQHAAGSSAEAGDGAAVAAAAELEAPEATGEEGRRQEDDDDDDDDSDETPYPVADEIKYCKLLNRTLPPDIRALAWCPTPPPGFSARFSCRERQYRYFFTQPAFAPAPAVLEGAHHPSSSAGSGGRRVKDGYLGIEAMREAARHFEGSHDFRNFCKIDASKQIGNFERRVLEADIVEVPDTTSALPYLDRPEFLPGQDGNGDSLAVDPPRPRVYYFHVRGTAFLWHQIRHMVAVLFLVGQGLEKPSVVADLLDVSRYPGRPNYHLASDAPLVLWDCLFGRPPPGAEGGATSSEAVEPGPDLDWVYAGEDGDPVDLHGPKGLVDGLWEVWRGRKMDELLANRLLDHVTTLTDPVRAVAASAAAVDAAAALKGGGSDRKAKQKQKQQQQRGTKAFEGGDGSHLIGTYTPLAKRQMQATPEDVNDKWAQSKGFASAAELAGTENWRSVIKARKLAAAEAAAVGGP